MLEKDMMKNNKWNTLKQTKQMQNLKLNCSVSPKVSCKRAFMFLVILTSCFWCSIQICLNLYCKFVYAAAQVFPYLFVCHFGFFTFNVDFWVSTALHSGQELSFFMFWSTNFIIFTKCSGITKNFHVKVTSCFWWFYNGIFGA